jgi:LysM repeat protein/uncharacterized protein YkwD
VIVLLAAMLIPAASAQAGSPGRGNPAPSAEVSAGDLILAMNTLRVSNGLPALVEDGIIDAVAQGTAETMAANEMSWHIGDVSGRIQAAGYGGGSKVWATENFAVALSFSIDEIMAVWSDASHMIPAVTPAYCNIGAGTAKAANGTTYYVLQAAYTAGKSCGSYTSPGAKVTPGSQGGTSKPFVSQVIIPVKQATPDADGKVYHVVQAGQSFWAIAVAYKTTIKELEIWNNLTSDTKLQVGQKLFIPGSNTVGYATPTPVGMILVSTPAADGKIIHTVEAYQALSTIADAYGTSVDTILTLNGLQADWPLQIGQKLIIHPSNVTPSPTPRPLKPVEQLTQASDGKYYHIVKEGETLSWIAQLYEIGLQDLVDWNGLTQASIIQPGRKLVLQVTPPATHTPTPGPPTETPTATAPLPTQTLTPTALLAASPSAAPAGLPSGATPDSIFWWVVGGISFIGVALVGFGFRKKKPNP